MGNNKDIIELAFNYVLEMSHQKKYNPQTVANINYLNRFRISKIINIMEMDIKEFCKNFELIKVRDFVYKSDYFTPRDMYLISPLFYTYYTCIVFKLVKKYLKNKSSILDFSKQKMKIFYSGLLDFNASNIELKINAMFNESYKKFQKEREKFFGKPVLKVDIQNFFNSINTEKLIKKLRDYIGDLKEINDLEYFFYYCGFNSLPQFHYSIASSILSQFYLVDFDLKMLNILERENLFLIRFVDDMFIIHQDGQIDTKKDNTLLNEISYLLWQDGLVLNTNKTESLSPEDFKNTYQLINKEYGPDDRSFLSEKIIDDKINEILKNGYLIKLVEELCEIEKTMGVDLKKYKELTDKYLSINGEDTRKILNNLIFSRKWKMLELEDLKRLVNNWTYILFNPSQFTILYILVCRYLERTKGIDKNGKKIKRLLNYLFRNDSFTFRDTLVTVSYLFQNNSKNSELLKKVSIVNPSYVKFIEKYIE
jgi:hypothetical protein